MTAFTLNIFFAEHAETVEPYEIFFNERIYGAAVLALIKIFFIFDHGTPADKAHPVVDPGFRFKSEYRTAHDGFKVFEGIFIARHHAGGAIAVIGAIQTDGKMFLLRGRLRNVGMKIYRRSLLRSGLFTLHDDLRLFYGSGNDHFEKIVFQLVTLQ